MKLKNLILLGLCSLALIACGDDEAEEMMPTGGSTDAGGSMDGGSDAGGSDEGGSDEGGSMDGGNADGGMMMGPQCADGLAEVGQACDPFTNCCRRGSECYAGTDSPDLTNTCVRRCDDNLPDGEDGCELRELCIPDDPNAMGENSPGYCISGDECEPGNENLACGEGDFSCHRARNLSFCIDLRDVAAQAPTAVVGVGEACSPFAQDQNEFAVCDSGLVCEFGKCRALCDTNDDCGGGECYDFTDNVDGINFKFCMGDDLCDPFNSECGDDAACILPLGVSDTVAYDGQIIGVCDENFAPGTREVGEECTVDPNTYFGDCSSSSVCSIESEGDTTGTCASFCDDYSLDQCTGYQVCSETRIEDLGICSGACDPYLGRGCGEDEMCVFFNVGQREGQPEAVVGECFDIGGDNQPSGEFINPDDTCEAYVPDIEGFNNPFPFYSNCGPGYYCDSLMQGDPKQCLQLCQNIRRIGDFESIDTDEDGLVTEEEWTAAFANFDSDADGSLSSDEWLNVNRNAGDLNRDGGIDAAEWAQLFDTIVTGEAPVIMPPMGGMMSGGEMMGGEMTGGAPAGGEMTGGAPAGGEMSGGAPAGGEMSGGAPAGGMMEESKDDHGPMTARQYDWTLCSGGISCRTPIFNGIESVGLCLDI